MRAFARSTLTVALTLTSPVQAQTYDPSFPVCLQSWTRGGSFISCVYMSMEQCRATASGRSAMCMLNPYFAGPAPQQPRRRHRSTG